LALLLVCQEALVLVPRVSEGSLVSDLVDRQLQQQLETQELAVLVLLEVVEWVLLTAISNEEAVLLVLI